jgi:uncharacterized protein
MARQCDRGNAALMTRLMQGDKLQIDVGVFPYCFRPSPMSEPTAPRSLWRSRGYSVWRVIRIFLVAYLVILLIMMFFENALIFPASQFPEGNWNPRGISVEDANFTAADGTRIHGWYLAREHPRAVVLYCHGNGGNITHRADVMRDLSERVGVSLLMFDYRGYGKSEGSPHEAGVVADARAARAWLAAKAGVDENRIVLIGESLGGAVAVDLATDGARALILEDTFSTAPDVAAVHYPWIPVRLLMRTQFNSVAKIASYHGPLFQSHGDRDQIVPLALARRLFDAANEPKQFLLLRGNDHNDGRSGQYYDQLREFLDGAP